MIKRITAGSHRSGTPVSSAASTCVHEISDRVNDRFNAEISDGAGYGISS
jgi:hypothetical protein